MRALATSATGSGAFASSLRQVIRTVGSLGGGCRTAQTRRRDAWRRAGEHGRREPGGGFSGGRHPHGARGGSNLPKQTQPGAARRSPAITSMLMEVLNGGKAVQQLPK